MIWRLVDNVLSLFMIYSIQSWIYDTEWGSSCNSNSSFHVGDILVNLLFLYKCIATIRAFWHKNLYMKTCYSLKCSWVLKIFLVYNSVLKCVNTPKHKNTKARKMFQYPQVIYHSKDFRDFGIMSFTLNKSLTLHGVKQT